MKEFMVELIIGSVVVTFTIILLREIIKEIKIRKTISIGYILTIILFIGFLLIFSKTIALSFNYKEVIGTTKGTRKTTNKGISITIIYQYSIDNKIYYGTVPKPNYEVNSLNGNYWVRVSNFNHNISWMDFKKNE